MMRWLAALLICLWVPPAQAQDDQPTVTLELSDNSAIVGQPLTLRIRVLVPTWMPKTPDFPNFEMPGLLVRLPERASGPISERIGSETWAGLQRAYRLYPLVPGRFDVPPQTLRVHIAKPGTIEAETLELPLPGFSFRGTIPQPARDLEPLIIAEDFTLDAEVEGESDLKVGDAIVRTLTANIGGTTPILIPSLTPETTGEMLRAYPDEPRVSESEDRGALSGTRIERTSYIATAEGEAVLPAITLSWFNIDSGKVEEVTVPEMPVRIAPAAAQSSEGGLDWEQLLRLVGILLAAVLALYLIRRYLWPPLRDALQRLWARWKASELHAHRAVKRAIRRRKLGDTYAALEGWSRHHPQLDPNRRAQVIDALARVGSGRFQVAEKSHDGGWHDVRLAYIAARVSALAAKARHRRDPGLTPLNPDWS